MGWEKRGKQTYYYGKVRCGGRVRSEYWGRGEIARLTAEEVEDRATYRSVLRDIWRRQIDDLVETERRLALVDSALRDIVGAILIESGFHAHRGQWRRKRSEKANQTPRSD
ncbi:MAG: hypothetical protein KJ579_07905 [Verrucomicrobia bacterium]|nr:hypothetical protein [Verrucomicrobiota bacterium]